jgi:hypothetical protein
MISSTSFTVSVFRAEEKCGTPASRNSSDTSFVFANLPHSIQDMVMLR